MLLESRIERRGKYGMLSLLKRLLKKNMLPPIADCANPNFPQTNLLPDFGLHTAHSIVTALSNG